MKLSSKRIADMAILLSLSLLANLISFPGIGGFGRISFVYCAAYLCGIILGPYFGFAITFLGDLFPAVIFPQGPWLPLISISVSMIAFFVGVCYRYLKIKDAYKIGLGITLAFIISTLTLTPLGQIEIFYMYPFTTAKLLGQALGIQSPFIMLSLSNLISQPVMVAVNVIVLIPIIKAYYKIRKVDNNQKQLPNEIKPDFNKK